MVIQSIRCMIRICQNYQLNFSYYETVRILFTMIIYFNVIYVVVSIFNLLFQKEYMNKRNQLKNSLPPSFINKTIQRAPSPISKQFPNILSDQSKTKNYDFMNSVPKIPLLEFNWKKRQEEKPLTIPIYQNANQHQNVIDRVHTQRAASYRIRKIDSPIIFKNNDRQQSKPLFSVRNNSKKDLKPIVNGNQKQKPDEKKKITSRKSRYHPHCKIIKTNQIPFSLAIERPNSKTSFLDELSRISSIESEQQSNQPFITLESYANLQLY